MHRKKKLCEGDRTGQPWRTPQKSNEKPTDAKSRRVRNNVRAATTTNKGNFGHCDGALKLFSGRGHCKGAEQKDAANTQPGPGFRSCVICYNNSTKDAFVFLELVSEESGTPNVDCSNNNSAPHWKPQMFGSRHKKQMVCSTIKAKRQRRKRNCRPKVFCEKRKLVMRVNWSGALGQRRASETGRRNCHNTVVQKTEEKQE